MVHRNIAGSLLLMSLCIVTAGQPAASQETVSQLDSAVTPKFVDIGPITVPKLPILYGVPSIGEYTIETLGYSEIRVFVHVSVVNYNTTPLQNARLKLVFFHNVKGGSWGCAQDSVRSVVTSYIYGFTTQKTFGKSLRLLIPTENMPQQGPFKIEISYYLIP